MKSGVPFIFSCHANLRHLSFPLNSGRQPLGALLIGPFLTEKPDPEMFVDISERYSPGARELLKLYKEAGEIPIISPERAEQISWLISYLFTPFLSPDASASQDAAGYSEEEDDAVSKKGNGVIENAIAYMKQHFDSPITLQETAGYVDLNPSYFSTLFKQSCGLSFKEYLNYIRIEESKKLLTSTDRSILDIAIDIGFEDAYTLTLSADTAGVLERAARGGMDMTVGAEEVLQDYFSRLEDYEDQGIRKFNLSRYLGARAAERYREKADRVEMSEKKFFW